MRQMATEDGQVAEALFQMAQLEQPLFCLFKPEFVNAVVRVLNEFDGINSGTEELPAWALASLSDVGPVLEEKLSNPKGILEWRDILTERCRGVTRLRRIPVVAAFGRRDGLGLGLIQLQRLNRPRLPINSDTIASFNSICRVLTADDSR